jgi:class 3 adenylate cyclase/tetratricopeptide (TPR) repeat protein
MEVVACPNCGEENPAKFRLCGYCGAALAQALPAQELRKTVTIIFSDLKGSTALGERIDPEALHEVKNRYFDAMAGVLAQHGGKIEKYIGDAIMAVFGLPKVREDDALRAVRAAYGMQQALARINIDLERTYGITLENRTGVNTGEVVATGDSSADQRLADGDAVNVAARLEQAAPAQEILIGDVTYRLVRESVVVEAVEPLTLKGKSEPVPAYRLMGMRAVSTAAFSADAFPLIGRAVEFASLTTAFEAVYQSREPRLVTLAGDAGVGKSRLIAEFSAHLGDAARRLRGRCLPYGEGITFWPLADVTKAAAEIDDDDPPEVALDKIGGLLPVTMPDRAEVRARVAAMVGLSSETFPVSELFWGARRLLEALAADRPLVIVIDDVHSAEQTFLEFLTHLTDTGQAPILIIASSRRELLERLPDWSNGGRASRIILEPLSAADTELVIDRLLGETGLAPGVRERVVSAAEGNPFFIEQMVSMLVERGFVQHTGDAWVPTTDLSELTIPPSINALLTARLDDLTREERAVIEPASVIGLTFPEPAVEELVPEPVRPVVIAQLQGLGRKQLVRPASDQEFYRFANMLIRDAAYQSLLKRARVNLHERFVEWAERVNRERERELEFEEILGYHLEQAFRYRRELGPLDDAGLTIGLRAAQKLASAGRRAFSRGDAPAAANLLRRAAAVAPATDPWRIELLPDLAEALTEHGDFESASAVLQEAMEAAASMADHRLEARIRLSQMHVGFYAAGSVGGLASAVAAVEGVIPILEAGDDAAGLARAWRLLLGLYMTDGHYEQAGEAAQRLIEFATLAEEVRLVRTGVVNYSVCALHGPTTVADALARCQELVVEVAGDRKAEAVVLSVLAVLYAMNGQLDLARPPAARAQENLVDLGLSITGASLSIESMRVGMLAGDPAAAELELRRDYDTLAAMGETYFRSSVAGLLGHALWALGRFDEADKFAEIGEALSDADDVDSQVIWRTVRAKLMARAGRADDAIAFAQEAVDMAVRTDDIERQADALQDLADILVLAGRTDDEGPPLRKALQLYERKGDVVQAARVRTRLVGSPVA